MYTYIYNEKKFTQLCKKKFYTIIYTMNKNIYTSLIKKPPLYARLGSKWQNFKQLHSNLLERTLFAVCKIRQFFS